MTSLNKQPIVSLGDANVKKIEDREKERMTKEEKENKERGKERKIDRQT